MNGPFRLYPEEQRWWSFNDYGHVASVVLRLRSRRVLEFGPGSSTLALLEGGAESVDACEDDPVWGATWLERLERRFPFQVKIRPYVWAELPMIDGVDGRRFDLALIDGPCETMRRPAVIAYAMARAEYVLVPTENSPELHAAVLELARNAEREIEWKATGPLAGGFVLMLPQI